MDSIFRSFKYIHHEVMPLIALGLIFTHSLFSGIKEDEAKIQQIKNVTDCYATFTVLLQDGIQFADAATFKNAEPAIAEVFSTIAYWQNNPKDFEHIGWDLYPRFVRAYSQLYHFDLQKNEQFYKYGYIQGTIAPELNNKFLEAYKNVKNIPFVREDFDPNYSAPNLNEYTIETLNKSHSFVMLEDEQLEALRPILQALKEPVSACYGTPWRVVSVRSWKTGPNVEDFGPTAWHTDGLPHTALKIMYYPRGASHERGTVELQLPEGIHRVEGGEGTWVVFKNSEVTHRGTAPQKGERIAVEITTLPAISYELDPILAGQNATHPIVPWQKNYKSSHPNYRKGEVDGINIGGGPRWSHPRWVNLEEVTSSFNIHSFLLFPNCRFPFENGSLKMVYTSHAMEHLNLPTVYRVLSEAARVLEVGGNLLIKIPDYDKTLDCWLRQDPSIFGPIWSIESVTHLWEDRGICDCLDHRAAMIFCSFFNDAYGNPFGSPNVTGHKAYFGPPVVSIEYLRDLIKDKTPSEIAKELRKVIGKNENNYHYCHQTAWSREEMTATLEEFGFEVLSLDTKFIVDSFGAIPGMNEMIDISAYYWVKKK